MHKGPLFRSAGYGLSTACPAGRLGHRRVGLENPLKRPYLTKELNICDQGAFFVGGVPKITTYLTSVTAEGPPQQLIIGQMYVQFQVPKKRRQWPIIMVHGGGFTGSSVEATPQGSEGWLPYSLRNNLATFVIEWRDADAPVSITQCCKRPALPTT